MRCALFVPLAMALVSTAAPAAIAAPEAPAPASVDGGFRLEPRPAVDDVFGDSGEYRKIIDRSLALGDTMQKTREQFARAVQSVLVELNAGPGKPKAASPGSKLCPERAVAVPYARAFELGQGYLRTGRELARRHDQVRDFDRLGETVGLTPDYRAKVKRVFTQYQSLLVDYREMRVSFHDQLADELRYAGCDLERLLARAGASAKDEAWPGEDALGLGDDDPVPAAHAAPAVPAVPGGAGGATPTRPPQGASVTPDRSGILFYVDNTRCSTVALVVLDGRPLGQVPAATRAAWQTTPGPHDLCLLSDATGPNARRCGDPGTVRRSYLHEGWTIALRCE